MIRRGRPRSLLPRRVRVLAAGVSACLVLGLVPGPGAAAPAADGPEEPWNIRSNRTNMVREPDGARIVSFLDGVVITHGPLRATCDEARYVEGSRLALLSGRVVMTRDTTVVRAPIAHYDRELRIARFPRGVVVERPSGTAIGDQGTWWREEGRFELRGRAAAADTSGTLDANAMTYDATGESFWAVGDARLVDEATGVVVEGQGIRWDRAAGEAVATGAPSAEFEEEGVPVRVSADRLTWDPTTRIAVALGDVVIERETMEGRAGTATFYRAVNRAVLTGDPEIVDGPTVVSGDRIVLDVPEPGRRIVRVSGAARVSNRFLEGRERPEAGPVAPPSEDLPAPRPDDAAPPGDLPASRGDVRARIEAGHGGAGPARDDGPAPSLPTADEVAEAAAAADAVSPRDAVEAALAEAPSGGDDGPPPTAPADSAAAPADSAGTDPTPPWLTVPGDRLPDENLLFGEEIAIEFVEGAIRTVRVIGHGRSKFFPDETSGDLTEWNDVVGDTLDVWFGAGEVDSVVVTGNGVGEYRLPAGDLAGSPAEALQEQGKLVEYTAPRIRYDRRNETMHLDRGAEIRYKTMVLKSGTIDFEASREVMTAGGDPSPILVDGGDEIFGSRMLYHLPTQKGEIEAGRTEFENAWYRGSDIWKMGEDELAVSDAAYTTCDLDRPHYHFASRQMKIYLDDKVVAKPVVLKIREIPVFALPFYMASLKKGRQSGFLLPNLELGVDDNRGRFIRNLGYYWAPNDYMDLTTSFDFYPAQDRIVSYLNGRYNVRYRYDGRATLKYNRDVPNNRKDTALELEHRQTLGENTTLTGSARFVSTSSIYQDIDDDQRLDRDIRSHATLTRRFPGSNRSFRAEVERRENLDTGDVDETLPLLVFSQPSRPLSGRSRTAPGDEEAERGWLDDVYWRLDSRFVSLRTIDGATETQPRVETRRTGARSDVSLSTSRTPIPYVQIRPSASGEATWIAEDRFGEPNALRATYGTSVSADTKLYGTFLRPVGPTRGFRHVIEPRVAWSWAPEFREYFARDENDVLQDRFESFGGIGGTPRRTNRVSFSLNNLVQTKLARGEEEKRYDLFSLGQSISYDLLARDQGRESLSNLSSSLRILSSQPINQSWTVAHDPYDGELLSSSVTTRVGLHSGMFRGFGGGGDAADAGAGEAAGPDGPADPLADDGGLGDEEGDLGARPSGPRAGPGNWRVDLSHTARRGGTANLVLNSEWSPTAKWRVSYMTEYDLEDGENTRQQWSVLRTVHCWQISFDRRLLGGEWQYYLRVNVTDLPDIQAERGDSFRGRRSSSIPGSGFF